MKKTLVLVGCALIAGTAIAGPEPVPPTSLLIDFGASSISGAGRLLKVTNVPVSNGTSTTYYNADLEFQFQADGSLAAIVTNASVASGPAAIQSNSNFNFIAGTYKDVASGCAWTMSSASIGPDGARSYTFTKNDHTCSDASYGLPISYNWSTAPGPSNPFVPTNQRASYPSDAAFGLASTGSGVRAIASGSSVSISYYWGNDGTAYGALRSFIKQ